MYNELTNHHLNKLIIMTKVYIIAAARSPIGSFQGTLSSLSATEIGAQTIKKTLEKYSINKEDVNEVFMGNVMSANLGQAPARQAAIFAGISDQVPCTTVNKVCASGMKALMLGAQTIKAGDNDLVITGGMENMSAVPYYLDKARNGYRLGNGQLIDGLVNDGLTDVYNQYHMGNAAELCAEECNITRDMQDEYAIASYQKSEKAWNNGLFEDEVVAIEVPQRKGDPLIFAKDEEYTNVHFDKIPALRTVFKKDGTVTAANASTLNDGASCIVIASEAYVTKNNIKPLASIISYADAAQQPEWFTTAPAKALPKAIEKANLQLNDIDAFEINEAFSVVSLANIEQLGVDAEKVNINGGAVSLGHPLGCSGSRIVVTLLNVLKQGKGKYGAAGICNGGGGASALVVENLQ